MKWHRWRYSVIILSVLLASLLIYAATVQSSIQIDSTSVNVYRDGLVHVEQTIRIGELVPQATVTLLADSAENLIVLDENELTVDYKLVGKELSIFSLGANQVELNYDINTLTNRENGVWTVLIETPYSMTVVFPSNSTIVYLNNTPNKIDTTNNVLTLSLGSGQWEISYLLELVAGNQNSPIPTQLANNGLTIPLEYLAGIIILIFLLILVATLLIKRRQQPNIKKTLNANPQLMEGDKAVLEFLVEKGGQAFEAEIRQRFQDMPRTSLWRLIKRLEKLGIVEVKKIGLENQVILKK